MGLFVNVLQSVLLLTVSFDSLVRGLLTFATNVYELPSTGGPLILFEFPTISAIHNHQDVSILVSVGYLVVVNPFGGSRVIKRVVEKRDGPSGLQADDQLESGPNGWFCLCLGSGVHERSSKPGVA